MQESTSVVLSGVGGYGEQYAARVLAEPQAYALQGFVDPFAEKSQYFSALCQRAKRYPTLEAFFEQSEAQLCVISAPIPYHAQQTEIALQNGAMVLCEKPAAATPQDIRSMIKARDRLGGAVDIGFQWSHSRTMLALKQIVASGALGKPKRLRCIVRWPRNAAYYARASWPGKLRDGNGAYILDSVASNATAHYLHNMFFVLGGAQNQSAFPATLQAELYRANPIETFDTCAMRAYTAQGVEVLFYASHAVKQTVSLPDFLYEFEGGKAIFPYQGTQVAIQYADGRVQALGDPFEEDFRKLRWCADFARGQGDEPPCPPEAALPLTLSVCAMHRSTPQAVAFPEHIKRVHGDAFTYVEGLDEVLLECYNKAALPNELGVSWSAPSKPVQVGPEDVFSL